MPTDKRQLHGAVMLFWQREWQSFYCGVTSVNTGYMLDANYRDL